MLSDRSSKRNLTEAPWSPWFDAELWNEAVFTRPVLWEFYDLALTRIGNLRHTQCPFYTTYFYSTDYCVLRVLISLLWGSVWQRDSDVTIGQFVVSDGNLACAIFIRHETLSDEEVKVCSYSNCLFCPTVIRQTEFDVTIGQCLVSDRNLTCTVLITHKTLSDEEVKVCLLLW